MNDETVKSSEKPITSETYEKLLALLRNIKYGSITIVIQDGQIVQIEKSEKIRLK